MNILMNFHSDFILVNLKTIRTLVKAYEKCYLQHKLFVFKLIIGWQQLTEAILYGIKFNMTDHFHVS